MFFNKNKHSFLIIEILLGIFLLAIFISIFISIPKITINPLIDKAVTTRFYHISDKEFFLILKNIERDKLPIKKGAHYISEEEIIPLVIHNLFNGECKKKFSITLREIKNTQEGNKLFLYDCSLFLSTTTNRRVIASEISYSFIIKTIL